jgi:hypothetical protein
MNSGRDTLAGGLPHSEISGSMLICQLPGAFRRLSRLSSPVVAKASTVCACSLDPLTPNFRGRQAHRHVFWTRRRFRLRYFTLPIFLKNEKQEKKERKKKKRKKETEKLSETLIGFCRLSASSSLWWSQAGSNRRPSACKADALPAELWPRTRWWVWVDSNHRPHPYQGCALTT